MCTFDCVDYLYILLQAIKRRIQNYCFYSIVHTHIVQVHTQNRNLGICFHFSIFYFYIILLCFSISYINALPLLCTEDCHTFCILFANPLLLNYSLQWALWNYILCENPVERVIIKVSECSMMNRFSSIQITVHY